MQNAKDSFYLSLRALLATANPERTVLIRGALRPAVLVLENELDDVASTPLDTFLLHWTTRATDLSEPLPLSSCTCVITYRTRGTAELDGMDRGRVLSAMGKELNLMLQPGSTPKQDYTGDTPVTLETNVFWSTPVWSAAELNDGTLARSATVTVFSLREAGE